MMKYIRRITTLVEKSFPSFFWITLQSYLMDGEAVTHTMLLSLHPFQVIIHQDIAFCFFLSPRWVMETA